MEKHVLHEKVSFTTMRELVEWAAEKYGERYAYSYRPNMRKAEDIKISFVQLRDDVRALASQMLAMGCAGKHIALIGKMTYSWVITYFATLCIGSVLAPLDRDWQAEDLADTVAKADATFLFGDSDIAEKLTHIAGAVSLSAPVILLDGEGENTMSAMLAAGREKYAADSKAYAETPIDPQAMALLVFTSGTTGKGKGVMLNQRAVLADMYNVIHYIDFAEKTVAVLPPHHTYGSTVMLVGHMMIGSEIYISSGIRYVAKELKDQQPGHIVLVPLYLETFYRKIMANLKDQGKTKLVFRMIKLSNGLRKVGIDLRKKLFGQIHAAFGGKAKTLITGGAPISPELLYFYDGIGIDILNGYGITECAPLIAVNRSKCNVLGSVGLPIDEVEVKIDEPNEDGEGEILAKGPNVMLGYYNDPETTAEAMDGAYFRTGDYGKIGKKGEIYITGRKKNLIILSNGKNVYPEEIEKELAVAPGVLDIIVYEGQSKRGMEHNAIVAEIYPDE